MAERRIRFIGEKDQQISVDEIRGRIGLLKDLKGSELRANPIASETFRQFCELLNRGEIRAAEKDEFDNWHANAWVKQGILMGFRMGVTAVASYEGETLQFSDKDTLPLRAIDLGRENIRVVPGGTSIRNGCFIDQGVIMMPPVYVNIGSYVGKDTMLDSHCLVGSCAQVGEGCHISAGAQIGGVLEPINANPCVIEDSVMMGINSSISEGVILKDRVVLGAGVQITASTPVYDLVRREVYTSRNGPIIIPENAVVIPGTRMIEGDEFAMANRLGIVTPIIKKYRDEGTDAKTAIEEALR